MPALLALVLTPLPAAAADDEIAPFRLTGVEGYVSTRYIRDDYDSGQTGPASTGSTNQTQTDFRQELFVMTHSYIYHPKLVMLDIGGGPILQYTDINQSGLDTSDTGALYNFTGRASFLREKPYRGAVFYEHLNPTLSVSVGELLTGESTRYGAEADLLAPVTPVPVHMDASRSHEMASGSDRLIDDRIDQVTLRASHAYEGLGSSRLRLRTSQHDSKSGNPGAPLQRSRVDDQGMSLDTRLQFGEDQRYDVTNLITGDWQSFDFEQGALPNRRALRVLLDGRARHSERLQTYGNYNYATNNQGTIDSAIHNGSLGASFWPDKQLSTSLRVEAERGRNTDLRTRSYAGEGSVRYERSLPLGILRLGYRGRAGLLDQQATAPQASVIGELITLIGTIPSALSRPRVVAGSVAVFNVTRTQTFVEGSDYVLSVVGEETRIERVVSGNIRDGEDVLVDYDYDVGGTLTRTQVDHAFDARWQVRPGLETYARYTASTPTLRSGTPTFTLNTVRSTIFGLQADKALDLGFDASVGGSYEYEDRRETISPFVRDTYDLYLQTEVPVLRAANLRLSMHGSRVDYANSVDDVDLRGYDLRLTSRHSWGITVHVDASYEEDTGGTVPSKRVSGSLKAEWRYRKVLVTAEFERSRESQGSFERKRTLAQVLLRRDF